MTTTPTTPMTHDDWTPATAPPRVSHAVLCVDDDPRIQRALKRALRGEPYELLMAESGQQALDALASHPVQVVVSDLGMDGMDGITLLSKVAERSPDVVRLVLSGRSDSRAILDAINSGSIYRYILKPWEDEHLKIVIRQALALWDLRTERQYLFEALQAHNRHLEDLVARRARQILAVERQADIGRYTSQIVHNLSNPLYALSGSIELLENYVAVDQPVKASLEKGLRIAGSAVDHLIAMVAGLLSHARQADQFAMAPLNVNELINQEIALFEMIPDFKYEIDKHLLLDPQIPPIQGNPVQIKQILDNLIKNALDAMEDTAVKRLTLQTAASNGHVVIRVSDTGQGIAPQHIERIFDPDFTTKPVGKGTGLGLASVKTMVEAYTGTIHVESTLGRETTFTIQLPALKSDPQAKYGLERERP